MREESLFLMVRTALFGIGLGLVSPAGADVLTIGGSGTAIAAMAQLGQKFSAATGHQVEIVPKLGSSGAIRAIEDGVVELCVSGRPVKPDEAARGLANRLVIRTPYLLVTSHPSPNSLTKDDVLEAFRSGSPTWADKEPIRVILRRRNGSTTAHLGQLFPGLASALEAARRRPEVITAPTDADNVAAAQRIPGSLTGMTYLQFKAEKPNLRPVPIEGLEPSFEAFEAGSYPFARTLYVVGPANAAPAAERFLAFLRDPEGQSALREAGAQVILEAPQ
jgi:phosphate transport system substrate-binding protein